MFQMEIAKLMFKFNNQTLPVSVSVFSLLIFYPKVNKHSSYNKQINI